MSPQDDREHREDPCVHGRLCNRGYCRVNKIEKAGVCVHRAPHVNAPVLECYPVTLECSLVSWDEESGFLTGKIECMLADESVLTDGKVDLDKLKPILFDSTSGSYRSFGPIVGKAFHDGLALKK